MSSRNVGIMSMQRIFNYGSSLQAYALRRLIEDADASARVQFLDYQPGPTLVEGGAPAPHSAWARSLAKVREYGRVDAPLADRVRFVNHKRRYANAYFPDLGIPIERGPAPSRLDVQVIGSDEVFNCVQSNTNVGYSRDLFGHGSVAGRLTSYAASFGNTTVAKVEAHGIRDELAADLARFDALSVRDANSAGVVAALTGREPEVHVDPVIAYDYGREPGVPAGRPHPRPYLVVYGYSGRLTDAENGMLRALARRRGMDILSFGGLQACATKFVDCHPFELLAYFRDAEAVVTDTFHGTIFSLLTHRPFATIVRPSTGTGYGNEEKLTDLLSRFGLADRRADGLDDIERLVEAPLDAPTVDAIVARERARSADYIRRGVLGG